MTITFCKRSLRPLINKEMKTMTVALDLISKQNQLAHIMAYKLFIYDSTQIKNTG